MGLKIKSEKEKRAEKRELKHIVNYQLRRISSKCRLKSLKETPEVPQVAPPELPPPLEHTPQRRRSLSAPASPAHPRYRTHFALLIVAAFISIAFLFVYGRPIAEGAPKGKPPPRYIIEHRQRFSRAPEKSSDDIEVSSYRNVNAKFKPRKISPSVPTIAPIAETPSPIVYEDVRSKRVVVMIDVPHGGGESLDCTFGSMKRVMYPDAAKTVDAEAIEFITVANYRDAAKAVSNFGVTKGLRHILPNASYTITMPFRHPVSRSFDAFTAAVGYNVEKSFPCDSIKETRPQLMADLLKSSKEICCEKVRNVLTKTFLGLPLDIAVGLEEVHEAVALIRADNFTIFMEEELEKSMFWLTNAVGVRHHRWSRCVSRQSEPRLLDRERDAVYEENLVDMKFMEEARHRWYTRWASRFEQSYDTSQTPCGADIWCWQELGAVHHIHRKVSHIVRMPQSQIRLVQEPYCAAECAF